MSKPASDVRRAEVTLRRYRPSDLGRLFALDCLCFAPLFRFSLHAMRRFATAPEAITLVAETASQEVAGFLIVQLESKQGGRFGYVVTIDVAPHLGRSGIATRLLRAAEIRAARLGALSIRLHVHIANLGAIQFYLARGYHHVSRAADFYGAGVDAEFYEKALPLPHGEDGSWEDLAW